MQLSFEPSTSCNPFAIVMSNIRDQHIANNNNNECCENYHNEKQTQSEQMLLEKWHQQTCLTKAATNLLFIKKKFF